MSNLQLRPYYVASLSGGKDSLYMLGVILDNIDKYPLDACVHYELEIDYPFVKNVIDDMKDRIEKLGIPFFIFKPRYSWYDQVERYGIPTRKVRWCNKYKMDCNVQLKQFLRGKGLRTVQYIGFCADEESRFKYTIGEFDSNSEFIYPLAEEGIIEQDILKWAKSQPIFNNYYKYNFRQGCMYCPMASIDNLTYLAKFYPYEFEWFIDKCIETENIYHTGVFQSQSKYNAQYYKEIIKNKYLPRLEDAMAYQQMSLFDN